MILRTEQRIADRASTGHDEILEAEVVAEGLESLFHKRLQLWRQPGYAWWRYQRDGHRSPAWDSMVAGAHAAYDPEVGRQDPDLARNCDVAIDAGCRDAMVYYRRGIAAFGDEDPEDGREWFDAALRLFEDRYVDNPYRAAAAETLAEWHRQENQREEVLRYFKIVVQTEASSYSSRLAVEQFTAELAAFAAAASALAGSDDGDGDGIECLVTGDLRDFPSAVHPDRVTALQVSPGGDYSVSVDASGYLQVTLLSRGLGARTIPIDGCQAHPNGQTSALWFDESTIVSGGSDGIIRSAQFSDDRLSEFEVVAEAWCSITAMERSRDGRVAIATSAGRVSLWNPSTDEIVDLERSHGEDVIVEFRCSDSWLLGRSENSELELWRLAPTP